LASTLDHRKHIRPGDVGIVAIEMSKFIDFGYIVMPESGKTRDIKRLENMRRVRAKEKHMNVVSQTVIKKVEVIMRGMIVQYEKVVRWWWWWLYQSK